MSTEFKILAWDPSLLNLGMAVGTMQSDHLQIEQATTFYVDKIVDKFGLDCSLGEIPNIRRVEMLEYIFHRVVNNYKPDLMVIEQPIYNNVNPKTLMIQMICITTLERLAHQYRLTFKDGLTSYMPNQIKLSVGVPSTKEAFRDKMEVTRALQRLEDKGEIIYDCDDYRPLSVDDHANDAVAMVYTKYKELRDVILNDDR